MQLKEEGRERGRGYAPAEGCCVGGPRGIGAGAAAAALGVAEDGGDEEGRRLDEVRAAAALHPEGDARDGVVLVCVAGPELGLGRRVGVELTADGEEFGSVAPGREDVLDHAGVCFRGAGVSGFDDLRV